MQKINRSLEKSIKRYNLEDKVKAYQVCKTWEKIIGDFLPHAAGKTFAVSLERGVLKIASLSREIATDIKLYAQRLVEEINRVLGKKVVFAIYCEC